MEIQTAKVSKVFRSELEGFKVFEILSLVHETARLRDDRMASLETPFEDYLVDRLVQSRSYGLSSLVITDVRNVLCAL